MPTLRVQALGGLTLAWDDRPLPPIPGTTARSLFAYLAMHHGRPHTRALLAGTFWPELPDASARRRLSQALWQIRRALEPYPALQAEGDTVQIDPGLQMWLDADEFECLAAGTEAGGQAPGIERLQQAVDLYEGDLLAGYYDDWVLAERERLRDLLLEALERLVQAHKLRGEFERALLFARRLAADDPWREEAHCEVMRLCHGMGRTSEALKQFEICRKALKEEMDAEPSAETAALARAIARPEAREAVPHLPLPNPALDEAPPAAGPAMDFVGRLEERAALASLLEAAVHDMGGLVLIEGEAGVGKTRLLQEVARDAGWRGIQVLWGRCHQAAATVPYSPWIEALQAPISPLRVEQWSCVLQPIWLQVLGTLLPSLAEALPGLPAPPRVEPEREQERLTNALYELLSGWSHSVPLLLLLEDLHWADQDSLTMLAALTGRLRAQRVLVVASYRGDEARSDPSAWKALQAAQRAGARSQLLLRPLDQADTCELVRRGLDLRQPAPLFASRLYSETGGNPLFVIELMRALYEEGTLFRDEQGEWSTAWDRTTGDYSELPVPGSVERVIARRLALLAGEERAVLEAAAVLGDDFGFQLLQETVDGEGGELVSALDSLARRRLLVEQHTSFRFGHDQVRTVAYRSMAPARRKMLHRRAATALESPQPGAHPVSALLAYHLECGEVWDRAVDAYAAAGHEAATAYAAESALRSYGKAIAILEEHRPFPTALLAERHFDLLAARGPLLHQRADAESWRADVEAMQALAQALADPERRVEALLQEAEFLEKSASKYDAARRSAEQALALAREHGLAGAEARAWLTSGTAWKQQGQSAAALEAFRRAIEAQEAGSGAGIDVYAGLVMTYRDMGRLDEAQEVARTALEKAQTRADPLFAARLHNAMAWIARAQGNHRAEAEHCAAMLGHMRAIGHRYYEGVALNNLSLAHSALGEYGPAVQAAEEAYGLFRRIDHRHGQVITLLNLSSRYKAIGQPAEARRVLAEALPLARDLSLADDECRILSSLAELLTHAGQHAAAAEALEHAEQLARQMDSAYLLATVHLRAGELALATGDWTQAADWFTHSMHQFEAAANAYYRNTARSFLALSHHRLGDLAAAVRLSVEAMAVAASQPDTPPSLDLFLHHYQIMAAAGDGAAADAALHRAYDEVQKRLATLDNPDWRRGFVEEMPLHRQVVAAWEAIHPRQMTARLPRAGVPTGRPLRVEEFVTVTWTVDAPEDSTVAGKVAIRRGRLGRLLREAAEQGAAPTVDDLAAALGASGPTVRRDLAALRRVGYPLETRGSRPDTTSVPN
ncbi:MAG TPA: AAA family ATPase [Anaerolineae bacterium]|nr:AAA family ATPase [Anaerolineae bacterium]